MRLPCCPGWKLGEAEIARIRKDHDAWAKDLARHPGKAGKISRHVSWRAQTIERYEQITRSPDGCYPTEIHVLRIGDGRIVDEGDADDVIERYRREVDAKSIVSTEAGGGT